MRRKADHGDEAESVEDDVQEERIVCKSVELWIWKVFGNALPQMEW